MLELFQEDIRQFSRTENKKSWLILLLTKEGLWALAEYRFNHWVNEKVQLPGGRQLLKFLGSIWHKLIVLVTGIELPKRANIGKGLYIAHCGSIVIHPNVALGEHCTISHNVTIGEGGRGDKKGWPKLGDRVYIAPGAKIFGAINIGNDVAIGANAVVNKSLPDNAVAVGIPAKIVSYKGSGDFIAIENQGSTDRLSSVEKNK